MPDAITPTVAHWRESLRMIQPRLVSLAKDKPDVVGFVVVLWDETAEEERRAAQLACAKMPTVEEGRAMLSELNKELNKKYPTKIGDPPDLVTFRAFYERIFANLQRDDRPTRRPVKSVKQHRRSAPRFPRPIATCHFGRFILYEYGDADGWREYWRITHSMRPLLAIPPRGITWPRREGNTCFSDCGFPFMIFQWALDRMPGFPHHLTLGKTTPKGETVEWAHSSELNLPEASADGIAKLLTIEPLGADLQAAPPDRLRLQTNPAIIFLDDNPIPVTPDALQVFTCLAGGGWCSGKQMQEPLVIKRVDRVIKRLPRALGELIEHGGSKGYSLKVPRLAGHGTTSP